MRHASGNCLPRTYIAVTDLWYAPLAGIREQPDWGWREIATGHDAMLTSPAALTDMLLEIASGG